MRTGAWLRVHRGCDCIGAATTSGYGIASRCDGVNVCVGGRACVEWASVSLCVCGAVCVCGGCMVVVFVECGICGLVCASVVVGGLVCGSYGRGDLVDCVVGGLVCGKCSRHLGVFCHLPAVDPVASQGNDPKRSNAPAISDYVVTSKLNGQIFVTCRSKY